MSLWLHEILIVINWFCPWSFIMEIIELSVGEIVISLPVIHLYSVMSWSWAPTPSGAEEKSPWMIVYRGDGRELNNKKFIIAVVWTDMNEDMILWLSICTLTIWWCAERKWIITLWNMRHNYFRDQNSAGCLDMGTSWYFLWKLNYFGIPKWK